MVINYHWRGLCVVYSGKEKSLIKITAGGERLSLCVSRGDQRVSIPGHGCQSSALYGHCLLLYVYSSSYAL